MSGLHHLLLCANVLLSCLVLPQAAGAQRQVRMDSVLIAGSVRAVPDSVLPELELQVTIAGHALRPGDTLITSVPDHAALRVWGSCAQGRVQWETRLPARMDSVPFVICPDSRGVAMCWPTDTVYHPWQPATSGCFPAASNRDVVRILEQGAKEPFESARFQLWQAWLPNRCLSLDQLRSIAVLFDDEGRKLDIIRAASCTDPGRLEELASLFDSKHYRNTYLEWAKAQP